MIILVFETLKITSIDTFKEDFKKLYKACS